MIIIKINQIKPVWVFKCLTFFSKQIILIMGKTGCRKSISWINEFLRNYLDYFNYTTKIIFLLSQEWQQTPGLELGPYL